MAEEKDDKLSPDTSPNAKTGSGVKRINNLPLYIIGGIGTLFVIMVVIIASGKGQPTGPSQEDGESAQGSGQVANNDLFADELTRDYQAGVINPEGMNIEDTQKEAQPEVEPAPNLDQPPLRVAKPTDQELQDAPKQVSAATIQDREKENDLRTIHQQKMQQLQRAIGAPSVVTADFRPSQGNSQAMASGSNQSRLSAIQQEYQRNSGASASYQEKVAAIKASLGGGSAGMGSGPMTVSASSSDRNDLSNWDGKSERWKMETNMENPGSPYELRAGFVIPGTMITGVNSDLPGQIMAQVSQNVYDTATGKHLLIPQGSRVVGTYSNDVAYAQERVMIAWQRIVFPDGKALDIGSMAGSDPSGYAGFKDKVNHHFWRIFGSAGALSVITAGVTLSQDTDSDSGSDRQRASDALSESMGQVLGQTMAQMISKNLNIAPTIEIRPGYRFNIMVSKDLTFNKPYQSFDY